MEYAFIGQGRSRVQMSRFEAGKRLEQRALVYLRSSQEQCQACGGVESQVQEVTRWVRL
jgi:SUMO ligase MMS21 Smc5/6 complex component